MSRLLTYLRTRIRRERHCKHGVHRETVEWAFGILQLKCLDCGAHRVLGFVFVNVSNRPRPHHPWELDDA